MTIAVRDAPNTTLKAGGRCRSGDVVAFCPRCKAFQTIHIEGSTLTPTRKFTQVGSQIYHDCGSVEPCRLYYNG